MTCITCGEIYTREEVTEWAEEGKTFTLRKDDNLICPKCTKKLLSTPVEQQIKELLGMSFAR